MKKILVIEDDLFIRENVVEILENEDYKAIGAEDGLTGLQMAKECQPDLILCDVRMSELDGYEVLEVLRQDPTTAKIPFVFLTAGVDRSNIRRIEDLGVNSYILKPFRINSFLAVIKSQLEKSNESKNSQL
jgi:CheY-like chemotaxis protein